MLHYSCKWINSVKGAPILAQNYSSTGSLEELTSSLSH